MPRRSELCFHSLSDLYFLKAMARLPMFFTCANDYADLLGEVSLMVWFIHSHTPEKR
jgi:hypothetical protein